MTEYLDIKEREDLVEYIVEDKENNICIAMYPNKPNHLPYFVLYNNLYSNKATKACSISLLEPKYLNIKRNIEQWVLDKSEINMLITILSKTNNFYNCSNYTAIIAAINDVYGVDPKIRFDYIKPLIPNTLPINYKMPDYKGLNNEF